MRFNRTKSESSVVNYEGGKAFKHSTPQHELYATVSTYLVKEPKFYGDANEEYERVKSLVQQVNTLEPDFVLQLAAYARNDLHLRSAPVMLLGLAGLYRSYQTAQYTPAIVKRADELAEVISFVESQIGPIGNEKEHTMLPHKLQKGLQLAFKNFNEYQFSKYDRNKSNVTMRDVIRLVHPKPETEEQQALYRKIARDELVPADTWEVLISGAGSTKENWEKATTKMPIMALIRNLRNLLQKEVSSKVIDYVVSVLIDENIILKSKQFPFRFFSAYKSIEDESNPNTGKLLTALDTAMEISIKNVPILDGITAVFGDNSGSMGSSLSKNSEMEYIDVSSVLSAIASKISPNNITGVFGDTFTRVNFSDNDSILTRANKIRNTNVGSSTNAYLTIAYLGVNNIKVDRVFIFSDEQCYDSNPYGGESIIRLWNQYKQQVNPEAYIYSFDLTGYGTTQIPESDPRTLTIGGWSESILKYVTQYEKNKDTVLKEIREITPAKYLYTKSN